ncbi:putative integral membrane protein [Sphaerochaeta pleomorpha str. Grapes]|uniref:Putative integral membrane protein n=1 Tax=Sphaerochaeta pleomorpha (strain ATCC BAA-1885 / DSM 22778 / Grapes) TaxID=158190 RepID=G8QRD5_SPHPG|nr:DUF624 domain-containing protein [Sphaerochaeta pleomorpha]AEV28788.1 putative integral membrane protein [Sphaerochaeta pleomorpha str. Grapes]
MQSNGMFDQENPFWRFMTKFFNVAYAGFLWFATSIPLVTMGASTVALYQYTLQLVKGEEGYVGKTFFAAFRKNFKKATILWACMVALSAFLLFDIWITRKMGSLLGNVIFFALLSLSFIALVMMVHIFPLLVQYNLTVMETIKRSFILGLGNLHYSVTLLVIFALQAVLLYYVPITIFVSTGFSAMLSSFFLSFLYEKYVHLLKNE